MTDKIGPSALKHGAFSKTLILPGEDIREFEKLRNGLIKEYRPSGEFEEETIDQIAEAMWIARRMGVYQHVKHLRIKSKRATNLATINDHMKTIGKPPYSPPQVGNETDEALLEFGEILSLDYVVKELEVHAKLDARIDRLLKRFFLHRTMTQMPGFGGPQVIEGTAVEVLDPPAVHDRLAKIEETGATPRDIEETSTIKQLPQDGATPNENGNLSST